jgi:hypothetical protein
MDMVVQKWGLFTSAIATLVAPALVGLTPSHWQSPPSPTVSRLAKINFPRTPSNGRRPNRTSSGGSRCGSPECYMEKRRDGVTPMTVLMPTNNVGTMANFNPTLFIYFPKSNIDGGEVVIYEQESDREVYLQQFDLSNKPDDVAGIVKLELRGINLKPGKTYEWSFVPFCFDDDGSASYGTAFLEGSFQRVALTPAQADRIQQAQNHLEWAEIYAHARIWTETLNLVERLRSSHPEEWENLLKSVELGELAEVPYWGEARLIVEEHKPAAEAILPNAPESRKKKTPNPTRRHPPESGVKCL